MDILYIIQYYLVEMYNSTFFGFIRFFMWVYVIVLVIDIILVLFLRGVKGNIIQGMYGADMPSSHKGKIFRRWKQIEKQLQGDQETQYKLAILDADALVDEVLEMAHISGETMTERLENALPYQVEHKDRLLWAHGIRNDIIRESAFPVNKDLAEKTIKVYEEFLRNWETI